MNTKKKKQSHTIRVSEDLFCYLKKVDKFGETATEVLERNLPNFDKIVNTNENGSSQQLVHVV